MYQNAPPSHAYGNRGGPPPQAGGYYESGMPAPPPQGAPGGGYPYGMAPSPVNAAYQRANAPMTARGPSPAGGGGGAASSGLIRLTLKKPMGIVFEPMLDPHNPSQQRGVRICDLPRTGAAAMSQKLELGDELLSINDKTMSRLTFDEIMDFIIEADKERVDLLFRRPNRNKDGGGANLAVGGAGLSVIAPGVVSGGAGGVQGGAGVSGNNSLPTSPMALGGIGSNNSNSVKWIDEKSDMGGKLMEKIDDDNNVGRSAKGGGNRGSKSRNDDVSVDDTYNDVYTVESQSQYTMETYEDDRRRGRRLSGRGDSRGDQNSSKRKSSYKDPVESMGFLDMLIDTLCTSVMGRHAQDMCGDDDEKNRRKTRNAYGDDFEDEFTVDDGTYAADDGTYATYEDNDDRGHRRRMGDEESLGTMEDEQTFVTNEDDGTRTFESKDSAKKKNSEKKLKDLNKASSSGKAKSKDPADNIMPHHDADNHKKDSMPRSSQKKNTAPDPPPTKPSSQSWNDPRAPSNSNTSLQQSWQQKQQHRDIVVGLQMNEQESGMNPGVALPLRELEYDDRIDYAADVSVMESLGGPSLLVERARHENAVNSGAHHALYENLDRQDPELAALVVQHGEGFVADPGMTREETAFRDPYKFYEFAVCGLLKENEPEKVRLLSKLMAKYRGRERHLINKLSARYNKEGKADLGASGIDQGAAVTAPTKGNASDGLTNKASTAGMEKIHEGEDGEEDRSSVLNDPSRANMAAIEATKKKIKGAGATAATERKTSNDDGWPPAMSDPWGAAQPAAATGGEARETNDGGASRPIDDDEGSYSDGSSYSGDDSGDEVDGTSPATIAQVSELLNYVYGKTSVAGQIDRVSTIMRAYEGREAVLLELLETKALIKANADSNRDDADMPTSLRNSPGLNNSGGNSKGQQPGGVASGNAPNDGSTGGESSKKLTPQTPVSMLTAPTISEYPAGPMTPNSVASPSGGPQSPSGNTTKTDTTADTKKKKKGIFSFFKKEKKPSTGQQSAPSKATSSPGKNKMKKSSKKGQLMNSEDDRSI